MGDLKTLGRIGEYEFWVHCSHDSVDFSASEHGKGFRGHVSIPWGVWEEVVNLAKPDRIGEELVIGELFRVYVSVTPSKRGLIIEAQSEEPRGSVEWVIPWNIWEEGINWINGPGKQSVAHHPGVVRKEAKFEIRKMSGMPAS